MSQTKKIFHEQESVQMRTKVEIRMNSHGNTDSFLAYMIYIWSNAGNTIPCCLSAENIEELTLQNVLDNQLSLTSLADELVSTRVF